MRATFEQRKSASRTFQGHFDVVVLFLSLRTWNCVDSEMTHFISDTQLIILLAVTPWMTMETEGLATLKRSTKFCERSNTKYNYPS
jgi:hypothetical protein